MKHLLEMSGMTYDAEQKIASVLVVDFSVAEDGTKSEENSETHSFHTETSPTKEEVIAYGKTLIEPDLDPADFEVVVTDMADDDSTEE